MNQANVSQNYKPSENEIYMNPQMQAYFREKLLHHKDLIAAEVDQILQHLSHEDGSQEPDAGERAAVETEVALEVTESDRHRTLLSQIMAALARIDTGIYGYCEETGEKIGTRRLEARPEATLTVAAQERRERAAQSQRLAV